MKCNVFGAVLVFISGSKPNPATGKDNKLRLGPIVIPGLVLRNKMARISMIFCSISYILSIFMRTALTHDNSVNEDGLITYLTNFTCPQSSKYEELLRFSIQNLRYAESKVPKPSVVIIPQSKQEVQKAVVWCRQEGFEIRVRSGGHSYEGTSCTADTHFAIIDLMNLNKISVDTDSKTAWVEGGATLGETYYAISEATPGYGFSAGSCPTVGTGGHISGGGFGFLSRKYGLAADSVIDAQLIDSAGKLHDRNSMGEEVFWALRGGGGGNWGVVLAWKIKLLKLPPMITVFTVSRRGIDNVADLVHRWQTVAPNLEHDFYLSVFVGSNLPEAENEGISATFKGMYLGPRTGALKSISTQFPELGIEDSDCSELSWIESVLYFSGLSPTRIHNIANLRDRYLSEKKYFKVKSDYVRSPIPKPGIRGACRILEQEPKGYVILDPYGGKMAEIPSDSIPFPHRRGNLYDIQYLAEWSADELVDSEHLCISWLRKFYDYMTPYVSQNPRAAYVNYIDFDLGTYMAPSLNGSRSPVEIARAWGEKYFLGNFGRLVEVKSRIDPHNMFSNPQSIPPSIPPGLFHVRSMCTLSGKSPAKTVSLTTTVHPENTCVWLANTHL